MATPTSTQKRKPTTTIKHMQGDQGQLPDRAELPHIIIEDIQPSVDHGRYAAKRVIGDEVAVEATLYKDGHDLISGRIAYRAPDSDEWQYAPMQYNIHFDRCIGSFTVNQIGTWAFTVEAWVDVFATWRNDLQKNYAGGRDVALELSEGAELVAHALRGAQGSSKNPLRELKAKLSDKGLLIEQRVEAAISTELSEGMRHHIDAESFTRADREYALTVEPLRARFGAWYELFPRSQSMESGRHGTFRDAEKRLPDLAARGFDVIYLPPIHPIGVTHRKGPGNNPVAQPGDPGCPWAIGSEHGGHTDIEPALGSLKDFTHFVRAARSLDLDVALDYALQCSPDHPWVQAHPDWFFIRADGSIKHAENPPKKYEDIYPINFWCKDYARLWAACRDIFLFWIDHGVNIFRVDNPHTKPFAFWEWVIGEVRREYPETVFLSEAFTRPARMKGLAKLGFSQSYTYFTWRNSADELREYLTELTTTSMKEYFRPNFFANTPDILHAYLQQGGRPAFRARLLLAATLSPSYGIYSGYELCENMPQRPGSEEYLHSEKYEVRVRDWDAPGNINEDIARINRIRRTNPALNVLDNLSFERSEHPDILFYRKSAPGNELLIAVNLNPHEVRETMVHVPIHRLKLQDHQSYVVEDLMTGDRYRWQGSRNYLRLDPQHIPGHVLRLVQT